MVSLSEIKSEKSGLPCIKKLRSPINKEQKIKRLMIKHTSSNSYEHTSIYYVVSS